MENVCKSVEYIDIIKVYWILRFLLYTNHPFFCELMLVFKNDVINKYSINYKHTFYLNIKIQTGNILNSTKLMF